MKKAQIGILILLFALIGAILIVFRKKGCQLCLPKNVDPFQILSMGSSGPEVLMLQKWMNCSSKSSHKILEDGIWGDETETMVLRVIQNELHMFSFDARDVFMQLNDLPLNSCT